jgi:hypothetical protein
MSDTELVEFCGDYKYETDAAYLVNDGDKNHWIPKSLCHDITPSDPKEGDSCDITIERWFAEEKGII